MKNTTCIIVTGMHRSGTSLTSSLLQSAGLNIGERLLGAAQGNPKGHFENWDFVQFHQQILKKQNYHVDGWVETHDLKLNKPELKDTAKQIILNNTSEIWGWKDPRTSLFLNFWKELIPESKYIFIYRSPWNVVDSILRRSSDPHFLKNPHLVIKNWIEYNQKIITFYKQNSSQCILYGIEDVFHDADLFIRRVNNKLNIKLNQPNKSIIDPTLLKRGIENKNSRIQIIKNTYSKAIDIYLELLKLSESNRAFENATFPNNNWMYMDWLSLSQSKKTNKQIRHELEQNKNQLNDKIKHAKEEIEKQKKEKSELEDQLHDALESGNIEHKKLDQLRNKRKKEKKEIAHLKNELNNLHAKKEHFRKEKEKLEKRIDYLLNRNFINVTKTLIRLSLNTLSLVKKSLKNIFKKEKSFIIHIDSPSEGQFVNSDFSIGGWCLSKGNKKINSVRAVIDNREFMGNFGSERIDVKNAFPNFTNALNSGIGIKVLSETGPQTIYIQVKLNNRNNWKTIKKININVMDPFDFVKKSLMQSGQEYITDDKIPFKFDFPKKNKIYKSWLSNNSISENYIKEVKLQLKKLSHKKLKFVINLSDFSDEKLKKFLTSINNQIFLKEVEFELIFTCKSKVGENINKILSDNNHNIIYEINDLLNKETDTHSVFIAKPIILSRNAFAEIILNIQGNDILYFDHDYMFENKRVSPNFKPKFDPILLLSQNYIGNLICIKNNLIKKNTEILKYFTTNTNLFLIEICNKSNKINNVPVIIYTEYINNNANTEQQKQIEEYSDKKFNAKVQKITNNKLTPESYNYSFSNKGPSVSIIIPTKNQKDLLEQCIKSISKTNYNNYQIVIIDNDSDDEETISYLKKIRHKVLQISNKDSSGFSFSHINNVAVNQLDTDYVLFLNNDTEVISSNWLSDMIGYAQMDGVGTVGAKLLYPDKRVQHAGIIHGIKPHLACHVFKLANEQDNCYQNYNNVAKSYMAVTAACLLTKRKLFLDMGGFNEDEFAVAYNDVDYCFRLVKEKNLLNVYCPTATLIHHETVSRAMIQDRHEFSAFKRKYESTVDPNINQNISSNSKHFELSSFFKHPFIKKSDKKINLLMCNYTLDLTGAALHMYDLAINFKEKTNINPIIYCNTDGELRKMFEKNGIEVYVDDYRSLKLNDALIKLKKVFSNIKFDVIYSNTLECYKEIEIAKQLKIPAIWNIHESVNWKTYFNNREDKDAILALNTFSYPYKIIFVSNSTMNIFKELESNNNFISIHNGLNKKPLEILNNKFSREKTRKELNIDKELVLLSLGTVCRRKAQIDLIKAFQMLDENTKEKAKILIVGDRDNPYSKEMHKYVNELDEYTKEKVIIINETSDVVKYYKASDVFIMNSYIESFPRVIMEALYYNLPIVTTPVFGVKEQVIEHVNCLYFNPGDIKKQSEQLNKIINQKELRETFVKNAKFALANINSFDEMIEGYKSSITEAYFTK